MIAYNTAWGVYLDQAQNETLSGNDIHHNLSTGVYVSSTTGTLLTNNLVHDNNDSGVWLSGGPTYGTTIIGGAYYSNGAFGIVEGEGAGSNTWRQISTYNNLGLGIDKNDNGLPDATGLISITAATRVGGVVSVTGEYLGGPNFRYHEIDLYRAAPDSSGFGEGRTYLGSTSFSDSFIVPVPVWTIVDPTGCGGTYTVVLTDHELFNVPPPQSFEFSANFNITPSCNLYSHTNLTSTPNPSLFGQSVTFTATVSGSPGTPTGSVTFYGGAPLGSRPLLAGVATFVTDTLPIGVNTITATYSGDTDFLMSTSPPLTETVDQAVYLPLVMR
jgi:parallel beta-helix repeat protein